MIRTTLGLLLATLSPVLVAQGEAGPKVSLQARFEPAKARAGDEVLLVVEASIRRGYHLYGSKDEFGEPPRLKFDAAVGKLLTEKGAPVVPEGEKHVSEEIPDAVGYWVAGRASYKQAFVVNADAKLGAAVVKGAMHYMACTETMCDEPTDAAFTATLTVVAEAPQNQDKPQLPSSRHQGNHQSVELKLNPKTARPGEVVTVELVVEMEPGWHNYGSAQNPELGEPTRMTVTAKGLEALGSPDVPAGDPHENFGDIYHYLEGKFTLRQQLRVPKDGKPGEVPIVVDLSYMACDDSICDRTIHTKLGATLTVEAGAARAESSQVVMADGADDEEDLNEMSLLLYLMGAVGAGLFALVMPCTYPMIPITVSFFTKQAEARGSSPVVLALAYGGGIVGCYVLLGGLLGGVMQDLATDPWLNLFFGLAFVAFALSLFGFFELKPPQFLMRSAAKAQTVAAGSASDVSAFAGVFLMGVTLCITSFACTAPFLGSMLAAGVSSGGDQTRLLLGMGVFGLTMATPFVVLSLVPGKLPRSGAWMNTAKIVFAFVELAAALKFFSNTDIALSWGILPRELFLTIWAGLFLVTGLYLMGFVKLKGETGEIGAGRFLAATVVLILALYFAHGAMGYRLDNEVMGAFEPNYRSKLLGAAPVDGGGGDGGAGNQTTQVAKVDDKGHGDHTFGARHLIVEDDYDAAVKLAIEQKKLLLLNFTGLL